MRFIWITALKDLRRLGREPVAVLTWLAIPSFISIILTLVFGPGGAKPHGTLLIADQDKAIGATMLTNAFDQGALGKMLTVEHITEAEGRLRMDRGDASALLVIPSGFSASFVTGQPVTIDLVRNPAQRALPDIIEDSLGIMLERAASYGAVAQTPPIQLDANIIPNKTEQPDGFAAIILPGALFMGIFFIAGALAADVWRERTSGALRRIATTPARFGAFLAGKLLAATLMFAGIGALALAVAHRLMHLRVASFPVAIAWIAASGSCLYLIIVLIQSAASSERVSTFMTNLVTLPLVMLGGGFVPFEWMPQSLARIGEWTPNGWCVMQLRVALSGSLQPIVFVTIAAIIGAMWLIEMRIIRKAAC